MLAVQDGDLAPALREAMRHLGGGVCIITAGLGAGRTGLTATSAVSLSMDPPTMLICVNRAASAYGPICYHRHFAINIPGADQAAVARRFSGRDGHRGPARYEGANWRELGSGALGLEGALAVVDCRVEEILERHSHAIVIGTVLSAIADADVSRPGLAYAHGQFLPLGSADILPKP